MEQVQGNPASAAESAEGSRHRGKFVRFVAAEGNGQAYDVTPDDFDACPALRESGLLRQFVANELRKREDAAVGELPRHVAYMRRHELVDYCEVSERGHHKWYPNGLLMQRLILDYGAQLAREWGAFEMKNPLLIRGDQNAVGELMGEFHERDYRVDGGRGVCYLRYASDPLGFPFLQKVRFTHRQTPLKVYEEALCFRNEQEGEVSGLKRVRSFMMTDMHAACASVEQAREEFERLCFRFAALMDEVIAPGRWVLGWEGTVAFFDANREWLLDLGRRMGVPAFFKLMREMSHYYAIKNEYQAITHDGGNIQVSTVQWDVKDGERFDIGYIDSGGEKQPCPVILHASSFGSVERTLCAILENIAVAADAGEQPRFPLWLSPAQVRVLPVSDPFVGDALALCERLSQASVRAEVDDRGERVGKMIRDGEADWIPYLVVVGEKERASGQYSVRVREDGSQRKLCADALAGLIREKTRGMPFRPLPLPVLLSRRPIFVG
jgi:threonyl-tRNA synthetase